MTEFADRWYFLGGTPQYPVAIFSPDLKRFLIRLKQGSVARNVVEYRLLLYDSDQAFASPHGEVLMRMSSTSNREGIQQVRWLGNNTITFLGENPGGLVSSLAAQFGREPGRPPKSFRARVILLIRSPEQER